MKKYFLIVPLFFFSLFSFVNAQATLYGVWNNNPYSDTPWSYNTYDVYQPFTNIDSKVLSQVKFTARNEDIGKKIYISRTGDMTCNNTQWTQEFSHTLTQYNTINVSIPLQANSVNYLYFRNPEGVKIPMNEIFTNEAYAHFRLSCTDDDLVGYYFDGQLIADIPSMGSQIASSTISNVDSVLHVSIPYVLLTASGLIALVFFVRKARLWIR